MKKTLFIIFCIFLSASVFALGKSDMKAFRELCGKAGISEDYVSLEPDHNRNGGFGCFSDFYRLWDDWTLISPYGISLSENIFSFKKSMAKFTETISERSDCPIDMDFAKREIKQTDSCLKDRDCFSQALKSVNGAYLVGNESQIPEKSKKYIAGIIFSAKKVASYRKDIYKSDVYEKLFRALHICGNDIDRKKLATGAYVLSHYTDIACNKLREEKGDFYVAVQTDLGTMEISSGQDNNYKMTDSFLVIDFSGNDTYGAGYGGTDFKKPVSVIIDLEGNDRYITDKSSSFGAGVMGWGFLADMNGDDEYRADSFSIGAGYGGVGMLMDYKGNDKYSGNICVQGSSSDGMGYLRDFEGNDTYYAYEYAQGFGGPGGVGVLADDKGNDVYTAEDKDIVNPSPQTADHNTSMSQGAGFGYRNENIAGGIGMLADREGDDKYSCGVFGQGISYWYSLGFLIDSKGNDTHNAVWYCYGAAAHYSVGCYADREGNDTYSANTAFGVGHDYSIGYFEDNRGDDTYICPAAALGWVNANGLSLFFDCGGDDDYSGTTFSGASNSWDNNKCIGIFLDRGGKNKIPENDMYKNKFWKISDVNGNPNSFAIGMLHP